jgi:hypothetical protein
VITAGCGRDTGSPRRFVADQRVERAARLEHAGHLQVFELEGNRLFDAGQAHIHHRRTAKPGRNAGMGGGDFISDRHGGSGHRSFRVRR